MARIGIISSQAYSLVNFRGALIETLVKQGHVVFALAPDFTDRLKCEVKALGGTCVTISLPRVAANPLRDCVCLVKLAVILRSLKLDTVLTYFIKPVIYGSIAAWVARVENRVAMIEGLGTTFLREDNRSHHRRLLHWLVIRLMRLAVPLNRKVILLNSEDVADCCKYGFVSEQQIIQIDGIGVDLDKFVESSPPLEPIVFALAARMVREKGVYEYVEAARVIRREYSDVRFVLLGDVDLNPHSLSRKELHAWAAERVVEWPGHVDDVRPWLQSCSVFVLPSYYREGVPRSIQEALAIGRPVITTDWIGCRETVLDGVNGFLVKHQDVNSLVRAMRRFIQNPSLISPMGRESRRLAEAKFDVHRANQVIIAALTS